MPRLGIGVGQSHQVERVLNRPPQLHVRVRTGQITDKEGHRLSGRVLEIVAVIDPHRLSLAIRVLRIFQHDGDFPARRIVHQEDLVPRPRFQDLADQGGIRLSQLAEQLRLLIPFADDRLGQQRAGGRFFVVGEQAACAGQCQQRHRYEPYAEKPFHTFKNKKGRRQLRPFKLTN